jgi:hypothetical protein
MMQALATMSIADKRMSPQTENPSWNATVPRGVCPLKGRTKKYCGGTPGISSG